MIAKSLQACALGLSPDGSEYDEIHCFKVDGTYESGADRLS